VLLTIQVFAACAVFRRLSLAMTSRAAATSFSPAILDIARPSWPEKQASSASPSVGRGRKGYPIVGRAETGASRAHVTEAEINARNHRWCRPRQRVALMERILLGRCSVLLDTQGGGEARQGSLHLALG
jgi:hypothetical protein